MQRKEARLSGPLSLHLPARERAAMLSDKFNTSEADAYVVRYVHTLGQRTGNTHVLCLLAVTLPPPWHRRTVRRPFQRIGVLAAIWICQPCYI